MSAMPLAASLSLGLSKGRVEWQCASQGDEPRQRGRQQHQRPLSLLVASVDQQHRGRRHGVGPAPQGSEGTAKAQPRHSKTPMFRKEAKLFTSKKAARVAAKAPHQRAQLGASSELHTN